MAVTIAEALGASFLLARGCENNATALGPDGCWDDVENPQNYTLRGPPSPVPDPVAIGALDGVVLGVRLARGPLPVAEQLRDDYRTGNGSEAGRPPSSNRRRDFGALVGRERLEKEVAAVLGLLRTLSPTPEVLRDVGTQEVAAVARWAAREFRERYVGTGGVAPPEWGWHPLNGVVTSQTGVSPPEWGCHVQRGLSPPKWQVSLQKWGLSPHKGGERVWKGPPPRPLGGQYCVSWMATTVSAGHRPPPCPSQGIPWAASPCPLDESQEGPSAGQMPPSPHGHCHVPKEFLVPPCPQGLGGHLHPIVPAECPAIVPRCLWGARSYWGTPSPLRPPLGSVFLHHTLEPARPCRTFSACAHAMRDMQRFHQDTRGWDDIGYRSLSLPLVPVTSHGPWHPPVGLGIVPLWALPPPLSPLTVPVTPAGLRHPPWSPSLSPCSPHHCPSTVLSLSLPVPSLSLPSPHHCPSLSPPLSPPLSTHGPHHCPSTVPVVSSQLRGGLGRVPV